MVIMSAMSSSSVLHISDVIVINKNILSVKSWSLHHPLTFVMFPVISIDGVELSVTLVSA